jgi:hypothetical protein
MRERAGAIDDVSEILTMASALVQPVHATLGIRGVHRRAGGAGGGGIWGRGGFRLVGARGLGLFRASDAVRTGFVRDEVDPGRRRG